MGPEDGSVGGGGHREIMFYGVMGKQVAKDPMVPSWCNHLEALRCAELVAGLLAESGRQGGEANGAGESSLFLVILAASPFTPHFSLTSSPSPLPPIPVSFPLFSPTLSLFPSLHPSLTVSFLAPPPPLSLPKSLRSVSISVCLCLCLSLSLSVYVSLCLSL